MYAGPENTLPMCLNEELSCSRMVNCGLNGSHPLALNTLLERYAGSLTHRRVLLHCNLLWMSSPEADCQVEGGRVNHPDLLPQLRYAIPAYRADVSERLSVALGHRLHYQWWVRHIRIGQYDGLDLHHWSLKNPYVNPLGKINMDLQLPENRRDGRTWQERGIKPQDHPWVAREDSLQWRAFRETVTTMRGRGNSVCVVLGPFNQHSLRLESRQRFLTLREEVIRELRGKCEALVVPDLLPSDEYGDASHPLEKGYKHLARQIATDPVFRDWLGGADREETSISSLRDGRGTGHGP
jgi:hypothetical protein